MSDFSEKPSYASGVMALRTAQLSEARSLVRQLAEPRPVGDSAKGAIRRAWRKLRGWTESRVKTIWYADRRASIRSHELDQLRALVKPKEPERTAADELRELRERMARMERMLAALDRARAPEGRHSGGGVVRAPGTRS